ncbi:MAG TPA: type II secretion system F family protein [Abditibacteriaceae bacterium]|jgi:tight adherence protein C
MLTKNSSRRSSVLAKRGDVTPFDRVMAPGMQKKQHDQSFINRVLRPLAQRVTDPSSSLMKNVNFDDIRFRLLRAGFPYGLRAQDFMLIKLLGTAGGMFLFTAVLLPLANFLWGLGYSPLVMLWGALLGAFYGFKLPDFWLSMTIRARQNAMQVFMPDMIDLITVSVEAGLGLDAAIQRVSQRFSNPLSEEFLRAMQEVRLGRTRVEALRDMARRTDVPDLTSFITSLVQAELLGIAIANVLRIQSERLREKRSQRAREQAQKAPIKMVFPLVLFIFPALFVVILGPALIQVLTTGFGG